jgi:hypothetical protein
MADQKSLLKKVSKQLFLLILFGLFSCSIQKRHYLDGFYVSWKKERSSVERACNRTNEKSPGSENLICSADNNFKAIIFVKKEKNEIISTANPDSCTDVILLRDGKELKGKVISSTPKEVLFKGCNDVNETRFDSRKVFMVKLEEGKKTIYNTNIEEKELNKNAVFSLYMAAFGIIILPLIPGLIFGMKALRQIKRNPDLYYGRVEALTGILVCSILLLACVAGIISLILLA